MKTDELIAEVKDNVDILFEINEKASKKLDEVIVDLNKKNEITI